MVDSSCKCAFCSIQNDNLTVDIQALPTLLFVNEDNYDKLIYLTQSSKHAKLCKVFLRWKAKKCCKVVFNSK